MSHDVPWCPMMSHDVPWCPMMSHDLRKLEETKARTTSIPARLAEICTESRVKHGYSPPSRNTSSTAQGGGGSFKNRKPIGEAVCCESGMAERSHWWSERWLISLTISLSFSDYLPTYLPTYLSIYLSLSLYLSPSLFHLITYLSIYLSTYPSIYSI